MGSARSNSGGMAKSNSRARPSTAILQAIDNVLLLKDGTARAYERKERVLQTAAGDSPVLIR